MPLYLHFKNVIIMNFIFFIGEDKEVKLDTNDYENETINS